jgi:hypothetical protein
VTLEKAYDELADFIAVNNLLWNRLAAGTVTLEFDY